jgi:hypothetical protein
MTLILAPAALADIVAIQKAANIRRGIADEDIAQLGTRASDRIGSIKKIY